MTTPKLQPSTPVQYLKGVGPKLAQILQKKSIYTAWDLLFFLPIKYIDRSKLYDVSNLQTGKQQTFLAEILSYHVRVVNRGRRRILEMTVGNEGGQCKVVFFRFYEKSLKKKYPVGSKALFFGEVKFFRGVKQITHPEMEPWIDEDGFQGQIYPFYSLTDGLNQNIIRRIIEQNLEALISVIEEEPRSVRDDGEVKISLADAFRYVHNPPVDADIELLNTRKSSYHQRIIYDEFFYLQLGILSKRYKSVQKNSYVISQKDQLFEKTLESLPFKLTGAQQAALVDIRSDMSSGHPMNRLLQGDVGSGKTIVSFLSSLFAIESGLQVGLMAPTEILAEQHFKKLLPFEDLLGIKMEMLTSSTPTKKRKEILGHLRTGQIDLIIGTHALLTEDVIFHKLGLVIIDEQHRFGVLQRATLKNKAKYDNTEIMPHLLVMTATPIPRTLSMTVYGDLDVTIINELPQGRKPVETKVFRGVRQVQKMNRFIRDELEKGRQAYFVYPLVEESEKLDLKDATQMCEELKTVFKGFEVGLLHGKMKSSEKEEIMKLFVENKIQVLVSTTVIEVGVDVPNATVMVIEHAERFGLSQLHQLRGRVGRGSEKSYCFLVASYAQSEESKFRLKVMEDTTDGFIISEEDLKLRGPGDFLGTKQSGLPDFRLAQLVRDSKLLRVAQKRANEILIQDCNLEKSENQLMKEIMLKRWGNRLDLMVA